MITRMWYRWTALVAAGALLLGGCQQDQKTAGHGPQQAVSQLPSGDTDDMSEAPPPEILPDTHVAAGRLHESQGHLARAAEQYRLAIGARPDYVEAYNRLGIVLDRMGRFREADQALSRAIQLAPGQAYLRNNLAFSYIMQSRWPEAEAELLRAVELEPGFARARVNLGMVLAQQERFDQALEHFQIALKAEDAHYNLGLMYQSKRKPVEAARAFKAALKANPKLVAAQKRLSMLPADAVSQADQPIVPEVAPMALTGAMKTVESGPLPPATRPSADFTADEADLLGEPEPCPLGFLLEASIGPLADLPETPGLSVDAEEEYAVVEPVLPPESLDDDPWLEDEEQPAVRQRRKLTELASPRRLLTLLREMAVPMERLIGQSAEEQMPGFEIDGDEPADAATLELMEFGSPESVRVEEPWPELFVGPPNASDLPTD